MKKSLFRLTDTIELSEVYLICFSSNIVFDYSKTLSIDSYMLQTFIKGMVDHQTIIVFFLTFAAIVFHYQMLNRKTTEVFCRILVGDTIVALKIRYAVNCLMILSGSYLVSMIVSLYFHLGLIDNLYLVCLLFIYIIISAGQVR